MIDGSTLGLPPSGRIVTKLFRLTFLHLNEFKDQAGPLLNQALGGPVLFEKSNAVLITDSLSTIQRLERLIQELDKPGTAGLQPKFYPLQYAKAATSSTRYRLAQAPAQQRAELRHQCDRGRPDKPDCRDLRSPPIRTLR